MSATNEKTIVEGEAVEEVVEDLHEEHEEEHEEVEKNTEETTTEKKDMQKKQRRYTAAYCSYKVCKYGYECKNKNHCKFWHPNKHQQNITIDKNFHRNSTPCRYGDKCVQSNCSYNHNNMVTDGIYRSRNYNKAVNKKNGKKFEKKIEEKPEKVENTAEEKQ